MTLQITSQPSGELLSAGDGKRHLRLFDDSFDDEVTSLIVVVRDYCERYTQRTLRTAVTRTQTLRQWWSWHDVNFRDSVDQLRPPHQKSFLRLPWPPLLGVDSITYYDSNNTQQTLSSSNYLVQLSTEGSGRISWVQNATVPQLYFREDAVTITFRTGYADATAIPPVVLQAMKTKLTELWASGSDNEIKAAMSATDRLLSLVDWTGYA